MGKLEELAAKLKRTVDESSVGELGMFLLQIDSEDKLAPSIKKELVRYAGERLQLLAAQMRIAAIDTAPARRVVTEGGS